jgi:hypothetical protein
MNGSAAGKCASCEAAVKQLMASASALQGFERFVDLAGVFFACQIVYQIHHEVNDKYDKPEKRRIDRAMEHPRPRSERKQHRFKHNDMERFAYERLTEG